MTATVIKFSDNGYVKLVNTWNGVHKFITSMYLFFFILSCFVFSNSN